VYPVFDVKWAPIPKKKATRSEQIIKSISLLSQKATKFVHACDYDQEGEVSVVIFSNAPVITIMKIHLGPNFQP
jgi:DNA topoisomerase IA